MIESTRSAAKRNTWMIGAAAFVGLFVVLSSAAVAQTVNFAGKPISITVGSPVGGGYDAYARLAGRHLGKFLPGNPSVIVQNMPGAGSLIAANWLAAGAPTDGTAIAILPSATMFEPLLGNTRAQFDLRKVKWLASLNDYTAVITVWHAAPFMQAKDLIGREMLVGGTSPGSDVWVWPNLLNALIGTKFKVVSGYPGTAGVSLAMERGEVQGLVGDDWDSVKSNQAAWLRDKKIRVLMQLRLTRHPDLPDVPTALDFASDDTRDVLNLFIARQSFGRPFIAPPATPAPILAALREAFAKMLADPDFLQDAAKVNLTIKGASGEEISALVDKIAASPKSVIDRASAELRLLDQH
jgi:tripartite-type tricarboxylate transporter receptor subunit TctC